MAITDDVIQTDIHTYLLFHHMLYEKRQGHHQHFIAASVI